MIDQIFIQRIDGAHKITNHKSIFKYLTLPNLMKH